MTKHGGARKGAGRRYLNGSEPGKGTAAQQVSITVPQATLDALREWGNGNVSRGVRKATEIAKEATMENNYDWDGPGWYASRGEGRNRTLTSKVNMDGYDDEIHEANTASRQQGLGTAWWYDTEDELRDALN